MSGHESRKADAQSARFGSKSFVVLVKKQVIDQDEMISNVVRRARVSVIEALLLAWRRLFHGFGSIER